MERTYLNLKYDDENLKKIGISNGEMVSLAQKLDIPTDGTLTGDEIIDEIKAIAEGLEGDFNSKFKTLVQLKPAAGALIAVVQGVLKQSSEG